MVRLKIEKKLSDDTFKRSSLVSAYSRKYVTTENRYSFCYCVSSPRMNSVETAGFTIVGAPAQLNYRGPISNNTFWS